MFERHEHHRVHHGISTVTGYIPQPKRFMSLQYAVLADIHGNIWALDAVLADVRKKGIRHIINLGDILYGPLAPRETAELLIGADHLTIRGNQDRILTGPSVPPAAPRTLQYVVSELTQAHFAWLAALPSTLIIRDTIFACHGTPVSDEEYLLEEVTPAGAGLRDDQGIRARLDGVPHPVVLCGHAHTPRTLRLADGRLIINPGSVGLPAYTDDLPRPHRMEAGSPHARYAIIRGEDSGWTVEPVRVSYDWEAAAAMALKNGRSDWAFWIRTGRAHD